ncbi:MAG TPA: hypothetical protein VKC57_15650 [Ktedonobacterales bacterium]|nr:hypothetical protein [Ktedonobacterales bacterium]
MGVVRRFLKPWSRSIECGRIDVKDLGAFADTGEYDGHSGALTVSCYLIRHPKGTLLWDTGLSDKLAENKAGVDIGGFKLTLVRGVGATGTGFFNFCTVLFNRDVTACTYSVSLASAATNYPGADDTGEIWAFNNGTNGVAVAYRHPYRRQAGQGLPPSGFLPARLNLDC